jgi:hypothetical protein
VVWPVKVLVTSCTRSRANALILEPELPLFNYRNRVA